MRYRPLQWTDFDGWVELYYSRYDEVLVNPQLGVFTADDKPSIGDEAAFFGQVWKRVQAGEQSVSVAEEAGKIVGVCTIYRGVHREDRHVGTLAVAVLPDWRGRGVGSGLLEHALQSCQGKLETVILDVIDINERALRLYRKFGFEECGRTPRAFHRGGVYYDAVRMSKRMDGVGPSTSTKN